jgi:hypothetical protein
MLNNKLAANLKTRLQQWNDRVTISDVFLDLLPYFKEYRTFCSGYESAVQALDAALKKKDQAAYIKQLEAALLEKGKTLQYLLVLPTQRMPRYVQSLEGVRAISLLFCSRFLLVAVDLEMDSARTSRPISRSAAH